MILEAKRPALFVGHGVTLSEASQELTAFARKLGIPVISSPNGFGCIDMTDPLSLGFIGRNGAFPANQAGRHADVVIAVGARFDDRSASSWLPGYSWNFPHAKLIHVDVDPEELGRNYPPDLGILADARTFLRQLLAELRERKPRDDGALKAWHAEIKGWQQEWDAFTQPNFDIHATPIRPERVVADCQMVLPDDAILACDVGVNHNWYMQFWKARRPQTDAQLVGLLRHGLRRGRRARRQARGARPAGGRDRRRRLLHHGAARAVHGGRVRHSGRVGDLEQLRLGVDPRHPVRHVRRARARHRVLSGRQPDAVQSGLRRWARASGVEGITVTKSQDFKGALEHAVKANKPFLLDVHVDANVRPPATGAWQLPPTPYNEPVFGKRWVPDMVPARGRDPCNRTQMVHPQHRRGAVAQFPDHFGGAVEAAGDAGDRRLRHIDYRISMYQPMAYVRCTSTRCRSRSITCSKARA